MPPFKSVSINTSRGLLTGRLVSLYTQSVKSIPARHWDFPAAVTLFLVLLLSALRLIATHWTSGLDTALMLTFFGVPIGLALGASRFRPLTASLLALGYSLVLLPWTIGAVVYEQIPWLERMSSIFGRLGISLDLFSQKKPVEDTLLFIVLAALIYWVISLLAGYLWSRHENILGALLPTWVILVVIQVYDNIRYNRIIFLILCMFFSLLLLGRRFILQKRRFWKENRIRYSTESSKEMNLALVIFTSAILLLAWVIPTPNRPVLIAEYVWDRISAPWQSTRKDLGNAVAGLEGASSSSTYDYYNSDLLQLGQRAITGNATIFTVTTPPDPVSIRFYWRVRVYDQYNKGQWNNATHSSQMFGPEMPALQLPNSDLNTLSEFTFTISQGRIINLFTPAQTVWISRPAEVSLFQAEAGSVDPLLLRADAAIHAGESYRLQAIESNPTILELRQAGEEYPDWVQRHYLQIPGNLSSEVSTLAARLTSDLDTPYDKATAITNYLRREITYSKMVSRPPFGADILEWFLLDYKQGYCNYYATAEVILLRAVGIPARMVVGFAQGEKVPGQADRLVVKQKDAHAWPEVYFPGIGWVVFEPTTSQPVITRPTGITPTFIGNPTPAANIIPDLDGGEPTRQPLNPTLVPGEDTLPPGSGDETSAPAFVYVLFGFIIIGLSGFLFWRGHQRQRSIPTPLPIRLKNTLERNSVKVPGWLQRWAARAAEAPTQRAFNVIHHSLRRLGKTARPADTPLVASTILIECLPAASAEITFLLDEYQKFMFSQQPEDAGLARRASLVIRQQTNRAVLYNWLKRIRAKFVSSR
ncbi:MAG: hypothetical protein A2X25_06880 [Chloroflexi bacterium GWB2_49_20]|nr:MAG: hypothetical protein A2X25_06880 [Chloroflexi bacterium GWB2_49_20]OGN77323.1 MAG: hypothetical protein A2X26_07595 [Chloroflexi bacterium GWC2_49_37]OGN84653.1 MAG: hypothetical protein A2X27_12815 [Chloroflexi bacterium GWD2_49_16]